MMNVGFSLGSVLDLAPGLPQAGLYFLRTLQPAQMVNFAFGWSGMLAIALVASGVGLYFLRTVRPTLARDQDVFFAAVALLCGGILLFQGWRLDPILQFAQFLSVGSAIWFAFETIRLRGITTEQAKRSTPVVDDERPVSRVYRAELDELTPLDDRNANRRIRGTRDARGDWDDYEDSRRSNRRSGTDRYGDSDRSRRDAARPPLPPDRSMEGRSSGWNDDMDDTQTRSVIGGSASRSSSRDSGSARKRPPRPSSSSRRRNPEYTSSEYVDYQPIDYGDRPGPKDFD